MIREYLIARFLKNKKIIFKNNEKIHIINDIMFYDDCIICKSTNIKEQEP